MSSELIAFVAGLATSSFGYLFTWVQLKSTRAFDLRQAVYLNAAEVMANSVEFFSRVLDLKTEDEELQALVQSTATVMFKIHVVGTPPTIAALSAANQDLTVAAVHLMQLRATLRARLASSETGGTEPTMIDTLYKAFMTEALRASLRYQRCLVEVNICARRELGMQVDEAQYRAINQQGEQRIQSAITAAIGGGDPPV